MVAEGYKQTEVGVIPEDWEVGIIKDLVKLDIIEKPMDGNHGNIHPKSSDFVDTGIPFVMANAVQNGVLNLSKCSCIRRIQADSLQKGFSIKGDVLLTHKATIGNTAIVGDLTTEYVMLTPQVTYYRVKDTTKLNNHYLRHFFDSITFQEVLAVKAGGGTRSYIGIVAQQELPFILPPTLAEQEAIAEALSDADAWIESLEQLIHKKRQIKQGAMQELLSPWEKQENGNPPKMKDGWVEKALGYYIKLQGGFSFSSENFGDLGKPVIRISDVLPSGVSLENTVYHPEFDIAPDFLINRGDLLLAMSGATTGKVGQYNHDITAYQNQRVGKFVVTREDQIDRGFVKILVMSDIFKGALNKELEQGAQPNVSAKQIEGLMFYFPSDIEEQTRIAKILSDMDVEITTLEQKLEKARQLKQGMMQELLTGKTRLV